MNTENINFVDFTPAGTTRLQDVAIQLHRQDHVAIAKTNLQAGTTLVLDNDASAQVKVPVRGFIPAGHKIALCKIATGDPARRYGQIIGFATQSIQPGDHVHTHNLSVKDFDRDYAFGVDAQPVTYIPESERRTFLGYRRVDGKVATRNYIAVIASVNCSAHTCQEIARYFTPEQLAAYPNVDGVIALTHHLGCTTRIGGPDYFMLQRTLAGTARNPNVGAYLFVGLGCETNQISDLIEQQNLGDNGSEQTTQLPHLVIQDSGGIRKTVEAGIAAIEKLLPEVNAIERTPQPISELMLALECGGSDSWSGITANPLVGVVADEIVRQGGTVVLAETPEVYGAEHLLTRRAVTLKVGQKLVDKIRWWEEYTARMGLEIDNNPSPGNKAGGLTTIYEKSLGAVAKGGTTPLTGVYEYGEPVTTQGFTFMDTPGYDPVSVTGMVAGGCNLVLFTTGRGSVFGFKPAPSIKICTNSTTYERMVEDMDLNAGQILEGVPMKTIAADLLDLIIAVASGQPSKSEAQDVGEAEFNPWTLGGMV